MRVKIPATGLYAYPDVVGICCEPRFEDENVDTRINPTLIVEVLSDSTESYDRGKKSSNYRTVEALAEYLLVAQDQHIIEHYVKQSDGHWLLTDITASDETIKLTFIRCVLEMKDIYDKVQ